MKYSGLSNSTLAAALVLEACGDSDKNADTEVPIVTDEQDRQHSK